ncbi:Esterase FE4 [Papilio machaon]|uniref:Carboxylic ester hydrolase n=1 Tax=Papilio machaon TaxID=76193 RepID=A0A0N1IIX7_PAPMA|nr:Esterase FE4 [Papilio machaon]
MTTRAMFRRALLVMCALGTCVSTGAGHGHHHGHAHTHSPHTGGPSLGSSENPIAMTPSGPIRGSMMQTRRGRAFEAYRGIRYAEPPVGKLRFQPPKMIEKYEGVVDATQEGPACPLPAPPGYYLDEDCLRINVYTPSHKSKELLPVVFYIHAGGFYAFSGRGDVAGPHYLLDRDIVLVTINYRLGTLGFLSTGDALAPGNNGFKDQVAALRWVRRNIAAFGGDPDLVTITGCSAGSISVMLHMISPMSKGLFHRGISMSGSPTIPGPTPTDLLPQARRQAELVGCPTSPNREMVDCLKTKPWKELGDSLNGFYEFGFDPVAIWWPVIEPDVGQERFLAIEPSVAIREGRMHAVPHIISQTTDEFFWKAFTILNNQTLLDGMNKEWEQIAPISLQVPREGAASKVNRLRQEYFGNKMLSNDTATAKALGYLYGDAIISFPVHRMANLMCRHSPHPVYYYEFAYVGNHSHYEDPVTNKPTGAAHHDDLIYLFSLRYRYPDVSAAGPDADVVDKMTAIWYTFAKTGDPNAYVGLDLPELSGLHWPAMTPDKRNYLRIDRTLSIRSNLKEDRLKVWEELYPTTY